MNSVFSYVHAEDAPLYRAIMRVFMESKQQFVFHLRPQEVVDLIPSAPEQLGVESALTQLCEWGNLQIHPDTTTIGAVEDFYNPRPIYQLTIPGEAAEKAFALYDANAGREHPLQSSGLLDIRFVLQDLKLLSLQEQSDAGQVHRNLLVLFALFEDLSATAETLVDRLDRRMEFEEPEMRRLSDDGRRFSGELERESDGIAEMVRELDAAGFERLLHAVAERADSSQWRLRWGRIRSWFVSESSLPSNLERLRIRVRSSMAALLRIIADSNDKRIHGIDRSRDFQVLARWFAQSGSDSEAHALWRAAFGLCSARHLIIDEATLDDRETRSIPANTSWLDAPPLRIRHRDYRVNSRTSGLSQIIDRSSEKEKLAAASHEESQRLLNAQRRFGTGNRIRLSELEHLEIGEFEIFLDLLGEAVSARVSQAEAVEILSSDGCFRVKLEPAGDIRETSILTSEGIFTGPDQWIRIEQISTQEAPEVVA